MLRCREWNEHGHVCVCFDVVNERSVNDIIESAVCFDVVNERSTRMFACSGRSQASGSQPADQSAFSQPASQLEMCCDDLSMSHAFGSDQLIVS